MKMFSAALQASQLVIVNRLRRTMMQCRAELVSSTAINKTATNNISRNEFNSTLRYQKISFK